MHLRVIDTRRQVCHENEVDILRGVLLNDHVHLFVSVHPKSAISELVRGMKGCSSRKVQLDIPAQHKRTWVSSVQGAGYHLTTNGATVEKHRPEESGKPHCRSYQHQPVIVQS